MSSGKLRARAILSPPLKPPHVIILAVFSSKSLNRDSIAIGTDTPIYLERTDCHPPIEDRKIFS